mmetsp:Transcript_29611/g.81440  ORF Transcript_29611/g.81440 Transcript_29611/m.81440 type:complete len:229 (+) Transcript_29611:880-1566(+)
MLSLSSAPETCIMPLRSSATSTAPDPSVSNIRNHLACSNRLCSSSSASIFATSARSCAAARSNAAASAAQLKPPPPPLAITARRAATAPDQSRRTLRPAARPASTTTATKGSAAASASAKAPIEELAAPETAPQEGLAPALRPGRSTSGVLPPLAPVGGCTRAGRNAAAKRRRPQAAAWAQMISKAAATSCPGLVAEILAGMAPNEECQVPNGCRGPPSLEPPAALEP